MSDTPTNLPGEIDNPPASAEPIPAPDGRGVTAHGWPYVQPDDHPLQYPAVSQSLAEKLETLPQPGTTAALLPTQLGTVLSFAQVVTDAAGNADVQFVSPYRNAPVVTATPIADQPLTCVLTQVTTHRVYATIRNAAGAEVPNVAVNFVIGGIPA